MASKLTKNPIHPPNEFSIQSVDINIAQVLKNANPANQSSPAFIQPLQNDHTHIQAPTYPFISSLLSSFRSTTPQPEGQALTPQN